MVLEGGSRKRKVDDYKSRFCFVVGTKFFLVWSSKVGTYILSR